LIDPIGQAGNVRGSTALVNQAARGAERRKRNFRRPVANCRTRSSLEEKRSRGNRFHSPNRRFLSLKSIAMVLSILQRTHYINRENHRKLKRDARSPDKRTAVA
jgi:hypothetical protein